MLKTVFNKVFVVQRKRAEWASRSALMRRGDLWRDLQEYLAKTRSTGCGFVDYWELYREIRERKPLEVLECGTGVSTLVIAYALSENERETGRGGRVTSMEEAEQWLDMSRNLLPLRYHSFVDFRLSATIEDHYSLFRGVRYKDVPPRVYDYVFVDGPKYHSPIDGVPTFDFDFVHILRGSDAPVAGLIDKRVSTCFALQQLLGHEKVQYSPAKGLGFIQPCTRADLGALDTKLSSANFADSLRPIGRTLLRMTPVTRE